MRRPHRREVDPTALALLGVALVSFIVFGMAYFVIVYLADVRDVAVLRDQPWLMFDLTFGGLAFLWAFVILLKDYPAVQTMAIGVVTIISCFVAPFVLAHALLPVGMTGSD